MNILFLGTGAADWEAEPTATEGIRRMTSALVDECLLIDPAPSSYTFFKYLGKDESNIKNIILTHSHEDHLSFKDLAGFASKGKVRFWCHKEVRKKLDKENIPNLELCTLEPYEKVEADGFDIMPLAANHMVENSDEVSLHFLIEKDGKKLFYGCDGGWFIDKTWCYLRTQVIDCAVLECTCGTDPYNWRLGSHNSIEMVRLLTETMRLGGIIPDNSKVAVSHLAKTLHSGFDETESLLNKYGVIMARDGLVLEI